MTADEAPAILHFQVNLLWTSVAVSTITVDHLRRGAYAWHAPSLHLPIYGTTTYPAVMKGAEGTDRVV